MRGPEKRTYELQVVPVICRIAARRMAVLEASEPGEARERLLDDLKAIYFLLTPGVLEGAAAKTAAAKA